MKPEIKQRWIDALRSGEYKQTIGYLHKDGCFCAMGVLCDLYGKDTNTKWELIDFEDTDTGIQYGTMHGISSFPHENVAKWAGLEDAMPQLKYYVPLFDAIIQETIGHLNDHEQVDFDEFADLIQAQL